MQISVIIPTFNREQAVRRLLDSLCQQSLPMDQFEAIVVDDGSTDGTQSLEHETFPFRLTCLRQANRGATEARNTGAQRSQGRVLVFVDDDFRLLPETLEILADETLSEDKLIVLGTQATPAEVRTSVFARTGRERALGVIDLLRKEELPADQKVDQGGAVHFTLCRTGLLAVRREDFFTIGMFQDPTGGWPNWDDVDFGYRADRLGFRFRRSARAIGEHWDYSLADMKISCQRWRKAGRSAARLFQRYPELEGAIPMFYDKTPIAWKRDPAVKVARKLFRQAASTRAALFGMEHLASFLEGLYPAYQGLLSLLYLWIQGGYMFIGYREGLSELNGVR